MKRIVALAATFAFALAAPAFAESDNPQGRSWAEIAKLPDWTGNWRVDRLDGKANANEKLAPLPLTPLYEKRRNAMIAQAKRLGDDVNTNTKLCIPVGALRVMMRVGRIYEFLFTPGQVTIIPQSFELRRVYTDGRAHPQNLPLSFNGDSIGHWEGTTLVVDTIAIRPEAEFVNGLGLLVGESGRDVQMIERIANTAPDHLRIDSTVTSKTVLTAPYSFHATYTRAKFPLMEEICTQNNLAVDPLTGNQTFPTTPDQVGRTQ